MKKKDKSSQLCCARKNQTQAWELVTAERGDHGPPKAPGTQVMGLGWGAGCPAQAGLGEFI